MKKFLVGLLTVALAASMLVGCGKKEEKKKADNSLKDVQSKKELVLGLDSSFPPMGFTDKKDNIVGFDIDLAKEVTKRMGIKLKLQPINWNSKEILLPFFVNILLYIFCSSPKFYIFPCSFLSPVLLLIFLIQ